MGSTVHYQFQRITDSYHTHPTPPPNTREHAIPNEPTTKMLPAVCSYPTIYGYQFSRAWGCFLQGGGLPWRTMCFSKLSRMATAICWTWGSVCSCSLMLYKCCSPPSSISMLQYLEGFLLQTCCMAQTAHSWTPGVVKQPSSGKNGLKDLYATISHSGVGHFKIAECKSSRREFLWLRLKVHACSPLDIKWAIIPAAK